MTKQKLVMVSIGDIKLPEDGVRTEPVFRNIEYRLLMPIEFAEEWASDMINTEGYPDTFWIHEQDNDPYYGIGLVKYGMSI